MADSTSTAIMNWEDKRGERGGAESVEKVKRKSEKREKCRTFIMTSVSVSTSRMVSSYSTNVGNTWRPAAPQTHDDDSRKCYKA